MPRLKVRICLFFVVCLLISGRVFALTWPELKAQIEAKYKNFSNEIKDMSAVMEVETRGMGEGDWDPGEKTGKQKGTEAMGPSEIKMFMKGEKYRIESKMNMPGGMMPEMADMTTIFIFDGKDFWAINPVTGKQKLPPEANISDKNQMNWWKDMPEKGSIVGSEKIGDRDCYVVEAEDEDSSKIKGWIDKQGLLLVKVEQEANEGEKITILNSNFKKVKNWEIPYATEVFAGEKMMSKSIIKSVEIDKGLSDDLFDDDKI
jgi:outer membrane lipoprotein-sorting protein